MDAAEGAAPCSKPYEGRPWCDVDIDADCPEPSSEGSDWHHEGEGSGRYCIYHGHWWSWEACNNYEQ